MPGDQETRLHQVLQALSNTPAVQRQARAVLAFTAARWTLALGRESEALRHYNYALEMHPDLRPAIRAIYRLYARRDDVRNAVMYLDQEIRATRHPREAAALYRERGQLVERYFKDPAAAQQCYEAALKATPNDLAVLRSVERITLARGDVFGMIGNLESQLEVLKDPGAVTGVLHDLALLEGRHGGDLTLAQDLLLAALDSTPEHVGLINDLLRTAEVSGDPRVILLALEAEIDTRKGERRAMPLARASLLLREQRERPAAVALLHAAAVAQPNNISLWRSLEELAMSTSGYEMALRACIGQLHAIGSDEPATRAELFYRIGRLAMIRLDRVSDGLSAMRKALRLFPGHVPAIEDTARYLIDHSLWAQLLELLKLQISTSSEAGLTPDETAQAYLRTGQLLEEHLGDPGNARLYYSEASKIAPRYRPTRDRLERVLHLLGDSDALQDFYSAELATSGAGPRRTFLLSVLSQLYGTDDDPKKAISYLVSLLTDLPKHVPSLQRLARLLARSKRTGDLLRVTEQEIGLTPIPLRRAKLQHRAGELALQLGERERARRFLQSALEAVDDHRASISTLEAIIREDGDAASLLGLLRKRLLYANDPIRQVSLRLEISTLLANDLSRPEDAFEELTQLLQQTPNHLPGLYAAENLATRLERWPDLVRILDQHISSVRGPRTRALLLHRVANIRCQRLDDNETAIRDLERSLELWPQLGVARSLLLRLYERLGKTHKLQAFAAAGLTSERGADDRRAMALQLAELTPRPVIALQHLAAVAEARPEDFITQIRLARAAAAAGRPARAAGALTAATQRFSQQLAADTPSLLAWRYRAARAHESACNLDEADSGYASILDVAPTHELARRGRLRVKHRKLDRDVAEQARALDKARAHANDPVHEAAYGTIAAEIHERRGDIPTALKFVRAALAARENYPPALHCQARVLERLGGEDNANEAVSTLETLAATLKVDRHRVRALCRAGKLALRIARPKGDNTRAWGLFVRALEIDPANEVAFVGLEQCAATHGSSGAPPLRSWMNKRIAALDQAGTLDLDTIRASARLASVTDGAGPAVALLEESLKRYPDIVREDAGFRSDLAQGYAKLGRWPDVVRELDQALRHELSPERSAGLHYFAADASERSGNPKSSLPHYLAAARGRFCIAHALPAAARIAATHFPPDQRIETLKLLVELGDNVQRSGGLRALADLYRGPLKKPEWAVDRLRDLLHFAPENLDVVQELHRLLTTMKRGDEATACLLAAVAHLRASLRFQGLGKGDDAPDLELTSLLGLRRLFELLGESDGVYLTTTILESIDEALPDCSPGDQRSRDERMNDPWNLPTTQEGRPLDGLIGDLPNASALHVLHEGAALLSDLPPLEGHNGATTAPKVDLRDALPNSSGVVLVTRALARSLGIPTPPVFMVPDCKLPVYARLEGIPALIVDRRLSSTPFSPRSRDLLGRGLLRLATGGERVHRQSSPSVLLGVLFGLCAGTNTVVPPKPDWKIDTKIVDLVSRIVQKRTSPPNQAADLASATAHFAATMGSFNPDTLAETALMAQDRAGIVSSGDPRPGLRRLLGQDLDTSSPTSMKKALTGQRGTSLIGYLLSDDHLGLRRALGYEVALELNEIDLEELPA